MYTIAIIAIIAVSVIITLVYNRNKLYLHPTITDTIIPSDGTRFNVKGVDTWIFLSDGNENNKTIIFSHGNAGSLNERLHLISFWRDNLKSQYNFVIYDYYGYGKSSGVASIENCIKSLENVVEFVLLKGYKDIVLWGNSMGSGITAEFAAKTNVKIKKIVLQSTFTSLQEMVYCMIKLPRCIVPNELNTLNNLKKMKCKNVVIIHSNQDEIIPFSMTLQLKPFVEEFIPVSGGHNSINLYKIVSVFI